MNPRYGWVGLLAVPYFVVFEFLAPLIAVGGPIATIAWWAVGGLSTLFLAAFLAVAFLLGLLLSLAALALEEFTFRRHVRGRETARLVLCLVLESFGYRQLNDVWRTIGYWDLARRKRGWGAQRRRGIGEAAT